MKKYRGIIQFYLKKRGFGYLRIPATGEEYHFTQREVNGEVADKDEVEFVIIEGKQGMIAGMIKKI